MKGLPFVLLFTAMTFLSWGAYGPVLHHGAVALDHDSMRAFVGVGLAYFMIAVLFPFFVLKQKGESGRWTMVGTIYSFFAGIVGAAGALGIILALGYGGKPLYVMPLVFGFAPVVNTLVTAVLSRTFDQVKPAFLMGIAATALGAAGVLYFKPVPRNGPAVEPEVESETESSAAFNRSSSSPIKFVAFTPQDESTSSAAEEQMDQDEEVVADEQAESEPAAPAVAEDGAAATSSQSTPPSGTGSEQEQTATLEDVAAAVEETAGGDTPTTAAGSTWGIVFSIIVAALCWGSYGPLLHIGQGKMDGSRLRPFACVGLAYFFIAVAVPLVLIFARPEDTGSWNVSGMSWSFGAGILGAIGALGVIMAFNSGGKPYYVMPLIFGFAPVVNTFISLTETNAWSEANFLFYASLAVVIAGAVTVLTKAPKAKPKPAPAT